MTWTGIPAVPPSPPGLQGFLQAIKNNLKQAQDNIDTLNASSGSTSTTTLASTVGFPSIVDYGGVNDGTTDNDAAFAAAEASSFDEIYIPTGIFYCATRTQSQFNKGYYGPGLILLADGTAMPGNFTYMATAPTVWPTQGTTGFFRGSSLAARGEWHVVGTGVRTATSPVRYFEHAFQMRSAWLDIYSGSSGFEGESSINRTHTTQDYIRVRNFGGGGDVYGSVVRLEQRYTPPGSQTHFFSTATAGQYGGDVNFISGSSGTYATGWESMYIDQGNDVAVIAQVDSFERDNDTGARACVWLGTLFKSEGSKPADAAHVVSGKWRVGLDTVKANLTTFASTGDNLNIAINTALGHRWVMNSTASTAGRGGSSTWGTFFGNTAGDMFIESGNDGTSDFIALRFNRASGSDGRIRLRPNGMQVNVAATFASSIGVGTDISLGSTGTLAFGSGSGNYLHFNGSNFVLVKGGVTVATW